MSRCSQQTDVPFSSARLKTQTVTLTSASDGRRPGFTPTHLSGLFSGLDLFALTFGGLTRGRRPRLN